MKNLEILFRAPGLLEAIVTDNDNSSDEPLFTEGYRSAWVTDLMIDYHPVTEEPYSFMVQQFHKTYPLVIWALKMHMSERFDVHQAGLSNASLHQIFSWAYYHYVLRDGRELTQPLTQVRIDANNYTQLALGHALAMA